MASISTSTVAGAAVAPPDIPECPVCPGVPLGLIQPLESNPRLIQGACESCLGLWLVRDDAGEGGRRVLRVAGRMGLLGGRAGDDAGA